MKVTIVVPTIREDCIRRFLEAWETEFSSSRIILVEDNPTKSFKLEYANLTHVTWEDIDRDLGDARWIIPRRTDCVRSFGYYKAWQQQPDMIVTLDDDCYPATTGGKGFLSRHWERLNEPTAFEAWRESGSDGFVTRGVPYFNRSRSLTTVINHGLWTGIPDFDAVTQLIHQRYPRGFDFTNQTIPVGSYFPMCGMNLAFRPVVVPALYFLLMGRDYPYDRFGDIWAGIVVKKICDHLGYAINSGEPAVVHERASNVWANLRKEAPGLEVNEEFWQAVDGIVLTGRTFGECYREVAGNLRLQGDYWDRLRQAMGLWTDLYRPPTP